MSKGTATTLVVLTGALLTVMALLRKESLGSAATYKRVWAAGVLTVALAVFADFVPELVGPFAALIIIAAVAYDRGALGGFLAGGQPAATAAEGPAGPRGPIG